MKLSLISQLYIIYCIFINIFNCYDKYETNHDTYWEIMNRHDDELSIQKKQHVPSRGKNIGAMDVSPYRLPNTIYPISYNITIHPYFSNFTFNGKETIDIVMLKDTFFNENDWLIIEINAFDIMINYCVLYIDEMKHSIQMKSASVDTTTQIVSLKFKIKNREILKYMNKHNYKHSINAMLYIEYIGIIQIDMKGFYISSFRV